jgi:hypothetical protein
VAVPKRLRRYLAGVVADAHAVGVKAIPDPALLEVVVNHRTAGRLVWGDEALPVCETQQCGIGDLYEIGEMSADTFFVQPSIEQRIARETNTLHLDAELLAERCRPLVGLLDIRVMVVR